MRKAFSVFFLLGLMLVSALVPAQAQVSLGAADQTDVVVKVDGENEAFTVLRDYARPEQFYYVPNRPQLATRGTGMLTATGAANAAGWCCCRKPSMPLRSAATV